MGDRDQHVEEINRTSDHAMSASRDQGMPSVPDESIPWFQGIMVMNQPRIPGSLETND
jgi:hypothetical protein